MPPQRRSNACHVSNVWQCVRVVCVYSRRAQRTVQPHGCGGVQQRYLQQLRAPGGQGWVPCRAASGFYRPSARRPARAPCTLHGTQCSEECMPVSGPRRRWLFLAGPSGCTAAGPGWHHGPRPNTDGRRHSAHQATPDSAGTPTTPAAS